MLMFRRLFLLPGLLSPYLSLIATLPTSAQITPDTTLGNESSIVTPNAEVQGNIVNLVEGGAERGINLFHSFLDFNIDDGQRVYFANPAGILNIFSRVTGDNPSNIFGTLGIDGDASLFFLNPNGILFGPLASLDLEGSLLVSSGSSFLFDDGSEFSGVAPDLPLPILTVSITPGIQYGDQNASITQAGALRIDSGQSITLAAAGNLQLLAGSELRTSTFVPSGQAANAGDIMLTSANGSIQITESSLNTGSVTASDSSELGNTGRGGNIGIIAPTGAIEVDSSNLTTGTFTDSGRANDSGNITLTSGQGDIRIISSQLTTGLFSTGGTSGDGGNVTLNAVNGDIYVKDGSLLETTTGSNSANPRGRGTAGNGGDVVLSTTNGDILFSESRVSSSSFSELDDSGLGGDIRLTTNQGNISVIDVQGSINSGSVSISGNAGNAGGIAFFTRSGGIQVANGSLNSESISIEGDAGDGGEITFSTDLGDIQISNSNILSQTYSEQGNAANGGSVDFTAGNGNILITDNQGINAATVSLGGSTEQAGTVSFLTNEGDILIEGKEIIAEASSRLGNAGPGNAVRLVTGRGDIAVFDLRLRTSSVVNQGATVLENISGSTNAANGGDIILSTSAGEIRVLGNSDFYAGSYSESEIAATSGRIILRNGLGDISVENTTFDATSATRSGEAGNANSIELLADNGNLSLNNIFLNTISYAESGNVRGSGGDILLWAPEGDINAADAKLYTFSVAATGGDSADGGDVTVTARNNISGLEVNTLASDNQSGTVWIKGRSDLTISDVSILTGDQFEIPNPLQRFVLPISLNLSEVGQSGNTFISSPANLTLNEVSIQGDTRGVNPAGSITLESGGLLILENSQVISNTNSSGAAGDINVFAPEIYIFASEETSRSGLFALSAGEGRAGLITVATDRLVLNRGEIVVESLSADGGDIIIAVEDFLLMRNNSLISATAGTAQSGGNGGNITIDNAEGFIIAFPTENSDITANAFEGNGGNIAITTQGLFGIEFREELTPLSDITASSSFGLSGTVLLDGPDTGAIENSLNELSGELVSTETLTAGSCIARSNDTDSSFTITGAEGLPQQPGGSAIAAYPTGTVQRLSESVTSTAIQEPQGVYQLADGRLVLSHECH